MNISTVYKYSLNVYECQYSWKYTEIFEISVVLMIFHPREQKMVGINGM